MIIKKVESCFSKKVKNVAAYARVSTMQEEQGESYETQVKYYSSLIKNNPLWNFVKVYADQGITGTSANKRTQFLQMIEDARNGKIDLILVKSISRFARNTRDAIEYTHELKSHNVEIRFEREGISSFDPSVEMIFSILAAVAQEESRSISENTKWALQKLAEKGIRHIGSNRVLGYDEIDGKLIPNENAWIVKLIFQEYSESAKIVDIINKLQKKGAVTLRGNEIFSSRTIRRMLQNEIYVGDRLIQKQAPVNYLTKKPDLSKPYTSHYVVNHHTGIIDRTTWNKVQLRIRETGQKAL